MPPPDLESGLDPSYKQNFDLLTSFITTNIYSLTANLKLIQRLTSKLGTAKGSLKDEKKLNELVSETTDKFKGFGEDIKILGDWDTSKLQATQKFTQRNLVKEFGSVLDEFRSIQREVASKERELATKGAAVVGINGSNGSSSGSTSNSAALYQEHQRPLTENTPLLQQQSQILDFVSQNEVDFHSGLVEERENEIQHIQKGIHEINSIFKDLGTLVTEQGSQIDVVEDNISNLATNTENASKQLTQADKYQRSRGKWSCIILVCLSILVLIVTLAIVS